MDIKKILIISQHFPPEIGAGSNRAFTITKKLSENNCKIYLITSRPNYPNPTLYNNAILQNEYGENIKVYRTFAITFLGTGLLNRLINQMLFFIYSIILGFYLLLSKKIKLIITTSPGFLTNICGLILKTTTFKKWILEIRDLWPDSLVSVGKVSKENKFYWILKKIELYCYRKCNHIIVVTQGAKNILENQGIPSQKINVITNGINPKRYVHKVFSKDHFIVSYIGNLGLSQNFNSVIDAAKIIQSIDKDIKFYFIGDGLAKKKLVEYVNSKKIRNVEFIEPIIEKKLLEPWYQKTDLGIITLKEDMTFKNVIPSKLFDYGLYQIPILNIGENEGNGIISEYNLGVNTSSNPDVIAENIIFIKNNKDKFVSNYQDFTSDFSWDNLIGEYLKIIDKTY